MAHEPYGKGFMCGFIGPNGKSSLISLVNCYRRGFCGDNRHSPTMSMPYVEHARCLQDYVSGHWGNDSYGNLNLLFLGKVPFLYKGHLPRGFIWIPLDG